MALGTQTALLGVGGEVVKADGTSFSAPVVAGLTACLRQALPHLSNKEIVDRIRKSATLYNRPDTLQGYGLPRFIKCMLRNPLYCRRNIRVKKFV